MIKTRCEIVTQLRKELDAIEKTEILIDYIQELWETVDFLKKKFGDEQAEEIIKAASPCNFAPDVFYPHT